MNLKAFSAFLLFLTVYLSINYYIGWNIYYWIYLTTGVSSEWALTVIIGVLSLAYMAGQSVKHLVSFKIAGSLWMAVFHYAFYIFPVVNLFIYIGGFINSDRASLIVPAGWGVIALFIVYMAVGMYSAYSPKVKHYTISTAGKNSYKKAVRLVAASDMHFGGLSGKRHARRLVKNINKLDADIVLFPGDLVDDDPGHFQRKGMDSILADIRSKYGKFAVTGNHEYYGKKINELSSILEGAGIKLLQDETVFIDGIAYIGGRKDKTDRYRKPFKEIVENTDNSYPLIVMDHQPAALDEIRSGGADLLVCGHTHRGQVFPYQLITRKLFEVDWGHLQKGNLNVIVSSGFGFWGPPVRIGTRSEILVIDVLIK